ncbi:MAG: helix-turn-helix transcriptional regulator [Acidobacteria bacterium]|nr:helix-turn-helix transcriptional regulator [Acidobacteriota bacterium]
MRSDRDKKVDAHVGRRVRLRRTLLGMSQTALGQAVGLTFQQIQKYERGANRIGSGRLFQFAEILDVPVPFFFDSMPEEVADRRQDLSVDQAVASEGERMIRRETLELVRAYYRISDPEVRKHARGFVKLTADLAARSEEEDE